MSAPDELGEAWADDDLAGVESWASDDGLCAHGHAERCPHCYQEDRDDALAARWDADREMGLV